jgi:hypothetical protein
MLSWKYEVLETGEIFDALGEHPQGYINYSPDGRMMVLVLKSDRLSPAALVPTNEEKIALYDTMFAYAGTYIADEEKVVHSIDMSWNQQWTGTQQVRRVRLDGDRLTYITEPARNPLDGRECVHTVIFEKVPVATPNHPLSATSL